MAKMQQPTPVVEPPVTPPVSPAPVAESNGKPSKKTACPVSRAQFRAKAQPIAVTINGSTQTAEVKEFSTGSLGWYVNGKITVEVDGVRVPVQVGLNLTCVGSKELPE
jgi:hypothetical protein